LDDRNDRWWLDEKASDYLDRIFERYFQELGLPNLIRKSGYHQLAKLVPQDLIPDEVRQRLDTILEVAQAAEAVTNTGGVTE